jgi:bleomycin hydrolase
MIELAEEPLDSRTVQYLNTAPMNDGGQFDMAVNLVQKYGLVPQSLYPESYNSSNTGKVDSLITSKIREFALELREIYGKTLASSSSISHSEKVKIAIQACRSRKTEQMTEVYTILAMCCGVPPKASETFSYEFYDKTGKYQKLNMTPLELYHSLAPTFKAEDGISLINDPRNPTNKLYTVQRLGNVWGARPVLYVNTETQVMEDMIVKLLKADLPVWFGEHETALQIARSDESTRMRCRQEKLDSSGGHGLRSIRL